MQLVCRLVTTCAFSYPTHFTPEYRAVARALIGEGGGVFSCMYSCNARLITPPARRAWRSYKFASLKFSGVFFGVTSWATAHG